LAPRKIAVAANDAICSSLFESFLRIEGCVNTPEYDKCPTPAGQLTEPVPAKSVACVNAYAYDVAGLDRIKVKVLYRFIA
jgi:hypothetical protein